MKLQGLACWAGSLALALLPCLAAPEEPARPAPRTAAELQADVLRLTAELASLQAAAPDDVSARLRAVEAELARLKEELARLLETIAESTDGLESLSQADQKRVSVTVYGDFQAAAYTGQNPVFDGRAFEVVFSGHPHKRLSVFAEIEFEDAAGVGAERGGEIVVEQAYATLAFASLFNVRAGIVLLPFGNVNIDHFAPKREVVTKPLVAFVVAPSDWTDNGVGLYGKRFVGGNWVASYEAYAVAGLGSDVSALGLRNARQPYGADNNRDKALVGRLSLNHASRLEVGLSGYTGKYDDAGRRRLEGFAVDGLLLLGPLKVTGEYDAITAHGTADQEATYRGYYGRGVWSFGKRFLTHTPLGRDFEDPQLSLVVEHGRVRIDGPLDGSLAHAEEARFTAGLNYRPSSHWVLKVTREWNWSKGRPLLLGDADGWLGAVGFIF